MKINMYILTIISYNEGIHTPRENAYSVFYFRPVRAAWYRKVAICFWTCE